MCDVHGVQPCAPHCGSAPAPSLAGCCMRTGAKLALDLPSLFWKPLVGQRPTIRDLRAVDVALVDGLQSIMAIEDAEVFAEAIDETFVAVLSDDSLMPLPPAADAQRPVTFANRAEYVERVVEARLHESDLQIAAIQRGLERVVPLPLLAVLSWQEASLMICGPAHVNVRRAQERSRPLL